MSRFKETSLVDRQGAAATAKKAALEKHRAMASDPELAQRQAARQAASVARYARAAERKAARLASEARAAAEKAAEEAAREEARQAALRAEAAAREAEAVEKAARDLALEAKSRPRATRVMPPARSASARRAEPAGKTDRLGGPWRANLLSGGSRGSGAGVPHDMGRELVDAKDGRRDGRCAGSRGNHMRGKVPV